MYSIVFSTVGVTQKYLF